MNIITKKVRLIPAPFVGTILNVRVGDGLVFKIRGVRLAEGCEHITLDWGDGEIQVFDRTITDAAHSYPSPGEYTIRISDDIRNFSFSGETPESEYTTVYAPMLTGFATNATRLAIISSHAFHNAYNLSRLDISGSAAEIISAASFKGCAALEGEFYFPRVNDVRGEGAGGIALPFEGCVNITALHFSEQFEEQIKAGSAYNGDRGHTLGTGIEDVCRFDL